MSLHDPSWLQSIFAGSGAAMCLLDPRDRVLRANAEWLRAVGLEGREVVGESIWDLVTDLPADTRALHEEAKRGRAVDLPPHRSSRDHGDVWHEGRLIPMAMETGTGLLVIVSDITERVRMAETLRLAEARYRGVLEGMLEGCQVIGHDWRYLYLNDAALKHARHDVTEMLGRTMMEVYPGIEVTEIFRTLQTCMAERASKRLENRFDYPDGSSAWFELSIQPHPDGLSVLSADITDRKHADDTLRHVGDELGALVHASPVPIIALDPRGNVALWSAAAERVFGFEAKDVVGRPPPIVSEDMRAEVEALRTRAREGESINSFVTTRLARDGRAVPISLSTAPNRGPNGEDNGIVAILVDLTEQRALQNALVESEHRFAAAFEASPSAKLVIRVSDHRIVEVNRACLDLFDLTRERALESSTDGLPVASELERDRFWDELAAHGRVAAFPVVFRTTSGNRGEAIISAERIALVGEDYILMVVQDFTAQKRAERASTESDERFQQLAASIVEVFWLTDVAKGEVIYVSPAYDQIWGREGRALIDSPRDWVDAIHPADRARVLEAAQTKQALGTYDEEYRIVRPDGSIRWIRDRGFPVRDSSGRVFRVAGTAQDITVERELETQLRQTQKMESIGLLAGGVAHDFNNLLTVIGSSCDELCETLAPTPDTDMLLAEIRQATERAASLTRQLLAFSRREVIEARVVNLEEIIVDAEKMLRRILGEDVLLTISIGPERARVNVDPGSWVQVLLNLAVNARDAMPRAGKLTIETRCAVLGEDFVKSHPHLKPGAFAMLSVTDTGQGMSPEVQARVFDPFFTTKAVGRGTGLGLSVVHGIVAQSGGDIEVSSEVGVGTTFRMYIPLIDAPLTKATIVTQRPAVVGSETIFIVEDDDSIRRGAARALEKIGYKVLQAADGEEALEIARAYSGRIDLLMTDVVMPRMGGRDVADALRERDPQMRVLYTSGYTDDAVLRYGIQHSEVAFLSKPYDLGGLRRRVRDALDQV